ncbi:egt [Hemileuca sp. nucleopolyhedrovirus]|uniref:Ecdysteroid UDP-glucosyltransferase n=1 Tax=Hemileuca sp. nucleopolyhedrovirus TaxID=1367203 RepID=S5N3D8_9ABAC|nr:egt [Hemileuca sp. nucleopolyhedrovirus]AGR56885.1 egt [Hemileuca sp. nucleopolyhedrovirus]
MNSKTSYSTLFNRIFLFLSFTVVINHHVTDSAKILAIFPTPCYSHQSVFKVYIEALADRGHEVVVVKPTTKVRYNDDKNIVEIDASLSDNYFAKLVHDSMSFRKRGLVADSDTVTAYNYMGLVRMLRDQFDLPEVKKLIENRHLFRFDVLITEAFLDYTLIFSHLFGDIPVIQVSSGYGVPENFETMGAVSRHPVYYPNLWRDRFRDMNIWETIREIYMELRLQNEFSVLLAEQNNLLKMQFGANVPALEKLRDNVEMLFVNVHPFFDNNRPVPPNVQYLGGLHLHDKRVKPLSEHVQRFLDNSTNVVYVSFGSSIDTAQMDNEFLDMLLETFRSLPQCNFAWKFDSIIDSSRVVPDNVFIQSWFDQYSLLHHKNVKAFVTQGGVQSTDEAIAALVPMIGMPMMGDQSFNTNKYIDLGIGLVVDTSTVTSQQLIKAIQTITVIDYDKYKGNLMELRKLIRHQPVSALHKATWFTEHVITHKKKNYYKTKSSNATYDEYYMFYIIIPFASVFIMNHIHQLLRMSFS